MLLNIAGKSFVFGLATPTLFFDLYQFDPVGALALPLKGVDANAAATFIAGLGDTQQIPLQPP